MDYIVYVSEMDGVMHGGHFRKMESECDIARHISGSFPHSVILKASEYTGSFGDAGSIGIVVKAHSWGLSCAVRSFIMKLLEREKAYVYVVALGIGTEVSIAASDRLTAAGRIRNQLETGLTGRKAASDIFIRCRENEDYRFESQNRLDGTKDRIERVLSAVNFRNTNSLTDIRPRKSLVEYKSSMEKAIKPSLTNVFLDESYLQAVRVQVV